MGVLIPNITLWAIYIRKRTGGGGRVSDFVHMWTHVDGCLCGGISLLYANVARIILKRYLILENRRKILDSKGFIKNSS